MKVYKIPSNDYNSYLVVGNQGISLYHSGNVSPIEGSREVLLGGSELLTTSNGLRFIIPSDLINYSYPQTLLQGTTVVVKEINPKVVMVVLQAVKSTDPNAVKFIPSSTFRNSRPGYVFTTKEQGTGYYLDKIELAKQVGQTVVTKPSGVVCDEESGVCTINPVEKAGRMFQAPPVGTEPSSWSATGDPVYDQPLTNDFSGRESVLYRHQLSTNEQSIGPDSLPMHFQ